MSAQHWIKLRGPRQPGHREPRQLQSIVIRRLAESQCIPLDDVEYAGQPGWDSIKDAQYEAREKEEEKPYADCDEPHRQGRTAGGDDEAQGKPKHESCESTSRPPRPRVSDGSIRAPRSPRTRSWIHTYLSTRWA